MGSENGSTSWMVFQGSVVHSLSEECPLVAEESKLLGVYNGKVAFLEDASQMEQLREQHGFSLEHVKVLKPQEFLMPGMIDTHIHAPQYANVGGVGIGQPLLDWLQKYTYPTEAGCKDLKFAQNIYRKVVKRTLYNGTTTAVYYATIHLPASILLCDVIEETGQRAFVGKVNIDCNSPQWYCETTDASIHDTKLFVENVIKRQNPLLVPIVTPRFALCCTEELMTSLGGMAHLNQLPIQTHISENKEEVKLVGATFPHRDHYADVYDQCKLLTDRTILAHGIHLSDAELDVIKQKGTKISHCPVSNISLVSGLCDVRRLMDKGITVGLGTDISGGYNPSLLEVMRQAIGTSTIIKMSESENYKAITYDEAFYLATLGGSKVVGLEDKLGNFAVGKDFDALVIDPSVIGGPIDTFASDDLRTRIQRFIYIGDDRNIRSVYVGGVRVKHLK